MAKVLLVEDDNNLREIYQARLMAEGYDIVTAQNGEEALVVAKQNKPDLIISDVMMPRISGFEMLDILRNTNELRNTKVIMLTALGQDDDQKRANSLGANKYLVKSQVTLEDIVNAAKELLSEDGSIPAPVTDPTAMPPSMVAPAAPSIPAIAHVPDPTPVVTEPTPAPTATPAPTTSTPPAPVEQPVAVAPEPAPTPTPEPVAPAPAPAPTTLPEPTVAAPIPSTPAPAIAPVTAVVPTPEPTPVATPVVTPIEPPAIPLAAAPEAPATPAPVEQPVAVAPEPAPTPTPTKVDADAQGLEAEEAALQAQIANYAKESATPDPTDRPADSASNDKAIEDAVKQLDASTIPAPAAPPTAPEAPATPAPAGGDAAPVAGKKIIQPISDPTQKPDLDALLAKEEAKDPTPTAPAANSAPTPTPAPTPNTLGKPFDPNTSL